MTAKSDKIVDVIIREIVTSESEKRDAYILENKKTIIPIIKLLTQTTVGESDEKSRHLSLNCILIISAAATAEDLDEDIAFAIINEKSFIIYLIELLNINKCTDLHIGILVNLSRHSQTIQRIHQLCHVNDFIMKMMKKFADNELISALITNFTQLDDVRMIIVNDQNIIMKLFDIFEKSSNYTIRNASLSIIRNCCFDTHLHTKLLNPSLELITKLLYPIAGPEEFDDDDMCKLPIDLQYLGSQKTRESDPEIRKLLIESLMLLCATKFGREFIRNQNVYVILREFHKWENVRSVQKTAEDLIDIIIKKESEIEIDNLKELQISDDLITKFNKMDKDLLKDDKD